VLRQFGENLKAARRKYRDYVTRDVALGRRPELVSGSVSREVSGWKKVRQGRHKDLERRMRDSRILGEPGFVHSVLPEARQSLDRGYLLRSGSQRPRALARSLACYWAVRELGLPSAELARRFGMTPAEVNYAVRRGEGLASERKLVLDE
jgi:hypothetical protein